MTLERSHGYQPADLIAMGYAAIVVLALVLGPEPVPQRSVWLAGFSGFLLLAYLLRFVPADLPRGLRFFRDTYLLWALPFGYASAGVVSRAFTRHYYDDIVLAWEMRIFGSHPHTQLAALLPSVPLSEFLHFCYYAYLWLVPILGFSLGLAGRERELRVAVTTVGLTFYSCYAFFIAFPVLGPYYTFEHIAVPGSIFVPLVHRTLEAGATLGTAFPSSHCAVAVAVAVSAWRSTWRPLAAAISILAVGIVFATMYGGFHYAIDSAVGVLVGTGFALVGPRVHRLLARQGGWVEPTRI